MTSLHLFEQSPSFLYSSIIFEVCAIISIFFHFFLLYLQHLLISLERSGQQYPWWRPLVLVHIFCIVISLLLLCIRSNLFSLRPPGVSTMVSYRKPFLNLRIEDALLVWSNRLVAYSRHRWVLFYVWEWWMVISILPGHLDYCCSLGRTWMTTMV